MHDYANGENHASSPRTDNVMNAVDSGPWYRHLWVWFFIAVLTTAIGAGVTLAVFAFKYADDVVSDTWYKDGRAINKDMAAEERAQALGVNVRLRTLSVQADSAQIEAFITARGELAAPSHLVLDLRHPTIAERDRRFRLEHQEAGRYRAVGYLPEGRWQATLKPEQGDWRLYQQVWVSASGSLSLGNP